MRRIRHHAQRRVPGRQGQGRGRPPENSPTGAAVPTSEMLAHWLAADSLDDLCHSAYADLRGACGLSRLLIVQWNGDCPTRWALGSDDAARIAIHQWFERQRRISRTSIQGDGVVIDPELAQAGFQSQMLVVGPAALRYQVLWSQPANAIRVHPDHPVPRRQSLSPGPALWRLFSLALANLARLDHLRELSHIDSLTGVFNRRYFNLRLAEEVARAQRFGRPLALAIADLDHFKPLNDTRGHQAGDIILQQVSQLVRRAVRSIDILCRLGGDEFAVLMPDTDAAECAILGERLRRVVSGGDFSLPDESESLALGVSLGGAVFPDHADSPERLLWCADMALLEAKRSGGNRFVFHQP